MSSNINPFNIDGAYPVAGQDNDSQGFRDNFTNIRNNLSSAKAEIEDLQSKAVLKSALSGTTLNNNLAGSVLTAPALQGYSESLVDHSFLAGTLQLDFASANVHKVSPTGNLAISFASTWPATGLFGKMLLWVTVSDITYTMSFPVAAPGVTLGTSNISGFNTTSGVLKFDAIGTYVLAFSTIDGGQNILIEDLTRNYSRLTDSNFYYNNLVNSAVLVGYGDGLTTARTAVEASGNTMVSVFGGYNSVSVGNLSQANLIYNTIDTGKLASYTLTSARGNLQTGSITGVKSNDLLGKIKSVAYTGVGGTANVFQQSASINFYATGDNDITYGLGGNIAFFTADKGGSPNFVYQAMGIENDKSTRLLGNLILASQYASTSSPYVPAASTSEGQAGQIAWSTQAGICTLYICYLSGPSGGPSRWARFGGNLTW